MDIKIFKHQAEQLTLKARQTPNTALQAFCESISEAIKAAELGNYAIGAAITNNSGEILASRGNHVFDANDPFSHVGHAEIRTLARLNEKIITGKLPQDISNLTLYTSLEPCMMCTGAIITSSRISKVISASADPLGAFISSHPEVLDSIPVWREILNNRGLKFEMYKQESELCKRVVKLAQGLFESSRIQLDRALSTT